MLGEQKEASRGVGGHGQYKHHFQNSSHEAARKVLSPFPTGAGLFLPSLHPMAVQGCVQPSDVPPDSHMNVSQRILGNSERGSVPDCPPQQ